MHVQSLLRKLHRPVVIAVVAMRMVQVAVDQVIDVVAVRHRFVAAFRPVSVVLGMAAACMLRRALGRVACIYGQRVFFHPTPLGVM